MQQLVKSVDVDGPNEVILVEGGLIILRGLKFPVASSCEVLLDGKRSFFQGYYRMVHQIIDYFMLTLDKQLKIKTLYYVTTY